MDKVQKIREEVEMVINRRLNLLNGDYFDLNKEVDGFTNEIMDIIDSLQEEPVSKDLEEEIEEYWKNAPTGTVYFPMWEHFQIIAHHFAEWGKKQAEIEIQAQSMALAHGCPKELESEELEDASKKYSSCIYLEEVLSDDDKEVLKERLINTFKAGAQWQKEHLWKLADGDDLPEIDREVVVLVKYSTQRNIHDKEYFTYRVGFGHRPNPDGWDGRNIDTNEVTHYTPKLYDKGGWNAPDIAYWLDVELPKEIEL